MAMIRNPPSKTSRPKLRIAEIIPSKSNLSPHSRFLNDKIKGRKRKHRRPIKDLLKINPAESFR
jgi:hypothetical protein